MKYEDIYSGIAKNLKVPNTTPFDSSKEEVQFDGNPMIAMRLDGTNTSDAVSGLWINARGKKPALLIDVYGHGRQMLMYPSRIVPGRSQGTFTVMSADDDHPDLMFRPITANDAKRLIGRDADLQTVLKELQDNDMGM